ncbi:MAG: 3-hydroxyacyl-CoA dehydrogenase PaaC [Rhodocyclaceae bacterium]|nr:3-hydroxyacyl-CoA dehydrogenase PaaC [Rhodocyclaceae bacterium]MCP5240511.1 3-hydroxyacyl-CoA dehydrogenase PaaC [Zoogloeaceae bacterium]MCB1911148.1 3-hydroxyacyl-CoA dehydrogenase PaaC [Rhodocyclaceae bacterium]MCP5253388.1 3-hydroxyacyl-CoA dehydrogenase PaaC [Zoogloeaceae bacterium]MCP5295721.1 3-hydroxyacyl-CoA dehydrogenase PaaC [Zoogloeaceae bacterium]
MAALDKSVRVLVVGAGAMGSGIAHVAALAGHAVYLYDMNGEAVARGKAAIEKDLRFLVGKGKLAEADCEAALARVLPVTKLSDARDAGLAIEAIVEKLETKQELFAQLEALLGEDAILASNTSSLSITAMAAPLARPERLLGLHFFNPAPRMKLVEIVSGLATDKALADCLHATATAWGKVAVHARSTPGFIVNRVARPYYAEAQRVLAEGAATPATLDALLREGCGFPMGPFELMDLIGHDVNYAVTCSVFDACFGDKRFTPSLIQQELVQAGRLGRKSGRGFYDYRDAASRPQPASETPRAGAPKITVVGGLGVAAGLIGRFEAAGIKVQRRAGRGPGFIEMGEARLALSDGRSATRRAHEEAIADLVLFDLAADFAATPRIAVAIADQCGSGAAQLVVGTLQQAGMEVSRIDDVAGMVALRTVAMLANEAADAVLQGIGSARDIDTAMRYGTNYPKGPLAWADELGVGLVASVLANLRDHYGEERYRVSPLIQRKAFTGANFHE